MDDLKRRLRERADAAAAEGTATATGDALHFREAADAIEALQAKLHDMHRRAQTAEAALREPIEAAAPERRTLGRVMANAAFYAEYDRAEALQAQLAEARDKALEDAAMLMQRHGFGGSAAAIRAMKGERG